MTALIIGGSASGKSRFAENFAMSLGQIRYYIATMSAQGKDAQERIERHHLMRKDKGFETIECERNIGTLCLPSRGVILLEDMGNLCANEMFHDMRYHNVVDIILSDINKISLQCEHLLIVSNEVFSGGADYEGETLLYMQNLSNINNSLAASFDRVYSIRCGIEVRTK